VIHFVILAICCPQPPPRPVSASRKLGDRIHFSRDRHRPGPAVKLRYRFPVLGTSSCGGKRISHLRLQIVKIRRCRSFLALVASLADSPQICCRVLPEAFPATSSSAGVVRRVSTAPSRLDWPGEILALSPLSHSSQARQKPGIADRATPLAATDPAGHLGATPCTWTPVRLGRPPPGTPVALSLVAIARHPLGGIATETRIQGLPTLPAEDAHSAAHAGTTAVCSAFPPALPSPPIRHMSFAAGHLVSARQSLMYTHPCAHPFLPPHLHPSPFSSLL
jgi:hypothetical protein